MPTRSSGLPSHLFNRVRPKIGHSACLSAYSLKWSGEYEDSRGIKSEASEATQSRSLREPRHYPGDRLCRGPREESNEKFYNAAGRSAKDPSQVQYASCLPQKFMQAHEAYRESMTVSLGLRAHLASDACAAPSPMVRLRLW
jgi:hypothetical protein